MARWILRCAWTADKPARIPRPDPETASCGEHTVGGRSLRLSTSLRMPKVYLAGPDVFFPDAREVFTWKKEICWNAGLEGMSPLDNEQDPDAAGAAL